MRILIVTTFFPPLNSIASLRPYSWAKNWAKAGHDVTVLTMQKPVDPATDLHLPNPGFRLIEVAAPRFLNVLKREYREAKKEKVSFLKRTLIRFYHYLRYKRGIFNACRMPDFADFWVRPALQAVQNEAAWDLVVSSAGPYAVHTLAERLKRRQMARRWIADYRDNWSDNHIYPGLFPFTWIERRLERKLMRSADRITATSAPFAAKMQSRYPCPVYGPVHVIENGFDPDDFAALPPASIFPRDGKFRIVYTGTIYPGKQDATPFLQAIAELDCPSLEVIFVGHQLDHLQALVQRFNLAHTVHIRGCVSREEALCMQRDAHLLLFIVWKDLAERGVYSGKIYEYLFSGTEILATGASALEDSQALILESRTGVALNDVAAIKKYLAEKVSAKKKPVVQSDRAVLARFDRRTLAQKLLSL